ncbi:RNA-processing protein [Candidatus Woesearchaeota archaeon]|nr:MAG: RNA-processing protein [Candidatus Woesearchaeota archaeon]
MTSPPPLEEFAYELRIPRERIAVLIGKKGKIKSDIERATKTKIEIDSKEGEVRIRGKDALLLYVAREIIRAIGRGFNPEAAQQLLKQDYGFELISITDYARNQGDVERLRGRVIGEGGKSRRTIEELTGASLCVYGKTVGIIAPIETIHLARKAVEMLLSGSMHSTVYRWLERKRREQRI